ncbi:MAG: glycerophosphodiester phosphodiesterase family protein [Bacteroidota bacterium]
MNRFLLAVFFISLFGCRQESTHTQAPALQAYFHTKARETVLISAHRGGKAYPGWPENCLETMEYVRQSVPEALFEVDVAQSSDGVFFLMHDNSLDRTTNGQGDLSAYKWDDLQKLQLKDDLGALTAYGIPTLEAVLDWAQEHGNILTLDIKRSVDAGEVLDFVDKKGMLGQVVMITYSYEAAQKLFQQNPLTMLSVSIRNQKELDRYLQTGEMLDNLIAFTGTNANEGKDQLYDRLHEYGIMCMLGTLGNLDRRAAARGPQVYQDFVRRGINVLATDTPLEAWAAVKEMPKEALRY